MVPPPIALGLTLCEQAVVEQGTRNVSLINTFTTRAEDEFPSPPERFCAFAALRDGVGTARIHLLCGELDGWEEIYAQQGRISFPSKLVVVHALFRINQCSFPAPGHYLFGLFVDGELVAQRQIRVRRKEGAP